MRRFAAVLILLLLTSCTDSEGARELLEKKRYERIKITRWRPLMCGHGYLWSTGFIATRGGKTVSGTVCHATTTSRRNPYIILDENRRMGRFEIREYDRVW